jgi:CubicO group peptidase (beta-lactamase class C family)
MLGMMRFTSNAKLTSFMAVCAIFLCCGVSHAQKKIMTATLKKIDAAHRTITIEFDDEFLTHTLKVSPDAVVELNRERVDLGDIKSGMRITITGDLRAKSCTKISAKGDAPQKGVADEPNTAAATSADIPVNGECPEELAEFDKIVLKFLSEAKRKIQGGVVIVVKDGKCVMMRGYGHSDRDGTVPMDATTPMIADGFSKILTAAAMIKLADEGKVDVETPFFDAIQVKPTSKEEDVPEGSRWVEAPIADFLKDRGQFHRDPFIREYEEDFEFRKGFHSKIKGMPDGQSLDFDDTLKYDSLDLEYTMLGRLVAKLGGGNKYEAYVQNSLLAPLGAAEGCKVVVLKRLKNDEEFKNNQPREKGKARAKKSAKQLKEEEIEEENNAAYEGTAFVQFEAGRQYQTTAMTLDAAGSWVVTPKAIALFAKAFDDPENCPILKAESVELLFSRRGAAAEVAEGEEGAKVAEPKSGTSKSKGTKPYFTCGWLVHEPADGTPLHLSHRTFHSGPVAVASEGKLHIIVALTTGMAASKSGADHPLVAKLSDAAKNVKKWPDVDLFGAENGAEPVVAENAPTDAPATEQMPAENTANEPPAESPQPGLPKIGPIKVLSLRSLVERNVALGVNTYGSFLVNGGGRLLSDIKSSNNLDLNVILKRNANGLKALDELRKTYNVDSLQRMLELQGKLTVNGNPAEKELAKPTTDYNQAMFQLAEKLGALSNLAGLAPPAIEKALDQVSVAEEKMFTSLTNMLSAIDKTYPLDTKPAANESEFEDSINQVTLRMKATDQRLQSILVNRIGRINGIIAKGEGAPAADQALLPTLLQEIHNAAKQSVTDLQAQRAAVQKFAEVEKSANSKYAPAWESLAALIDAQVVQAQFIEKLGTPEQKPEEEDKILADLTTARNNFQQAMNAAKGAGDQPTGQPTADAVVPSAPTK